MKNDKPTNKKKYKSMQEELAARRAELGEEADPSQGRFVGGWTSQKSRPGASRGRKKGIPTAIFKKESSKRIKKEESATAKATTAEGSKSINVGSVIVGVVTMAIAIIAIAVFDMDGDETAYDYLDETSSHEEVVEFLDDYLDVDWDIDTDQLKEWEKTRLPGVIGSDLESWKAEVSREHVIIMTSYDDDKEDFDSFRERCENVSSNIDDDLYEYMDDSYPSVVIEARGVFPYSDHEPNLRLLVIDGDEEFSLEEY